MIKKLWAYLSWPRRAYDEKSNSEVWLLWRGRWTTGWGHPLKGTKAINRVMLFGRPFLKSFGKWERLRPGQPTRFQIAGSVLQRMRAADDALYTLLGGKEMPRGWGRQRLSKQQRVLLMRIREQVIGAATDVDYLIPGEKRNGSE